MLIEKPDYSVNDTITFKTQAGEEVVSRVTEINKDSIKVRKPMALTMTEKGIGMGPFSLTVSLDTEMVINLATVVFIAKTADRTAKQYIESTTGLKVAVN